MSYFLRSCLSSNYYLINKFLRKIISRAISRLIRLECLLAVEDRILLIILGLLLPHSPKSADVIHCVNRYLVVVNHTSTLTN